MTHVLSRDLNPRSTTAGQEVRVPVTVVEVPKMRILGVRGYTMTPTASKPRARPGCPARTSRRLSQKCLDRISTRKVHDTDAHFLRSKKPTSARFA